MKLPKWFSLTKLKLQCPSCSKFAKNKDAIATGVRHGKDKEPHFFCEVNCPKCGATALYIINTKKIDIDKYNNNLEMSFI